MRFIYTKTFTKIFTIFVLLAFLVILDAKGYLGLLKDGFFRVYGSAVHRVGAVSGGIKGGFSTLFTIKNLASDNASLSQKIDQLAFENARLKSAQQENQGLRKALNYKQISNFNLLPLASILISGNLATLLIFFHFLFTTETSKLLGSSGIINVLT